MWTHVLLNSRILKNLGFTDLCIANRLAFQVFLIFPLGSFFLLTHSFKRKSYTPFALLRSNFFWCIISLLYHFARRKLRVNERFFSLLWMQLNENLVIAWWKKSTHLLCTTQLQCSPECLRKASSGVN